MGAEVALTFSQIFPSVSKHRSALQHRRACHPKEELTSACRCSAMFCARLHYMLIKSVFEQVIPEQLHFLSCSRKGAEWSISAAVTPWSGWCLCRFRCSPWRTGKPFNPTYFILLPSLCDGRLAQITDLMWVYFVQVMRHILFCHYIIFFIPLPRIRFPILKCCSVCAQVLLVSVYRCTLYFKSINPHRLPFSER